MTKAKRVCPIKGSGGGSAEGAVSYAEEQSLTKIQKDRARGNIGAASEEEVSGKANNDGYYSKMSVGAAENLVGGNETSREFNEDTAGGSADIADGVVQVKRIKGNSVVWNQLLTNSYTKSLHGITTTKNTTDKVYSVSGTCTQNTTLSFIYVSNRLVSGHTYLYNLFGFKKYDDDTNQTDRIRIYKGASYATNGINIFVADGSAFHATCEVKQGDVLHREFGLMLYDLTQMFGAGNEPSTVLEFEKMFPIDYYDYNEGEIISLNPTGIKTIGFNAYDHATGKAYVIGGKQYQITGTYTSIAEGDTTITPDSDGLFTPSKNGDLTIVGGNSTTTCVHLVWSGVRNEEYEEHWEETRNIPIAKINTDGTITESAAGKTRLFPDGLCSAGIVYDEVTPTKAIKRIGKVDLGSLSWSRSTNYGERFFSYDINNLINNNPDYLQIKYAKNNTGLAIVDKHIYLGKYLYYDTKGLFIKDSSYSTSADFKAAMNGVYLYYELAEPIEVEFAEPLNLTYRVSDFGTETLLPINTATPVTTPIRLDVVYGLNAVDFVRNADKNYLTIEDSTGDNGSSFTNLRTALSTAFGIDIVPTYDSTNKRYTFAISDNRKVEVPESAASNGTKGTWAEDATSVYFCTDTNTWVKINKETW